MQLVVGAVVLLAHLLQLGFHMAQLGDARFQPFVLQGVTGSGKTEVYLHSVQTLLEDNPQAQALVMVPEINLTPQLLQRFSERLVPLLGAQAVVAMHSGMTPAQRLKSWRIKSKAAVNLI